MLPSVTLVDHTPALASAWTDAFADIDGVIVVEADYFAHPADGMVSPANSFGIMDGGLDLAIRDELGFDCERAAQARILETHHGELPVGSAEVVDTGDERWPYLIVAPTMRIPESIGQTVNAYLAFRAALLAVMRFNDIEPRISTIVCPGLGTGIGGLDPKRCALQMRMAYRQVAGPSRIPSYAGIRDLHFAMRRG